MNHRLAPWLLALALAPGPACKSHPYGEIDRANAGAHLDQAERALQEGRYQEALARLAEVRDVRGLDPDQRVREERLIDEAARRHFGELESADAEELEDLFDEPLPDRVRARAGVLAAERMLADDSRISAFRMIKKVDEALPSHPERVLAGDVLARAGLSLIRDDRHYNWILSYRTRGIQTLEYMVVNYPLEPHCPEAYYALSETYENEGNYDQAIERSEDLLLYHPGSAYAPGAAARLPYLRLARLARDDYDRTELMRAHDELARWLELYPEHQLTPWARDLMHECQRRLVESDLALARYYERVDAAEGQRLHARRALTTAEDAGLTAEAAEAGALLPPEGATDADAERSALPPSPTPTAENGGNGG